MLKAVLAGAVGAALMYFLDPRDGYHRVAAARDRVGALLPLSWRMARAADGRGLASDVHVVLRRPVGAGTDGSASRSDARLAARVEAELRGDPDIPPGQVTIRAENGRVILRGRLDHPEQIGAIVDRVRAISGVNEVENRLHMFQAQGRSD